jgi:hypothetical protein
VRKTKAKGKLQKGKNQGRLLFLTRPLQPSGIIKDAPFLDFCLFAFLPLFFLPCLSSSA